MSRSGLPLYLRLIAACLLTACVAQDAAWAAPDGLPVPAAPNFRSIRIAPALGRIESTRAGRGPMIVHIRDAHANPGAQKNTAEIIRLLKKEYGVDTVFLEGGTRDDSLGFLAGRAPLEARRRVANKYVLSGELSGPEFLSVTAEPDLKLLGVEEKALYDRNLRRYAGVRNSREKILGDLSKIEQSVGSLKRRLYPKQALVFDEALHAFRAGEAAFSDTFDKIEEAVQSAGLNPLAYPNLLGLAALRKSEQRVDFAAAQKELVARLSKNSDGLKPELSRLGKLKRGSPSELRFFESLLEGASASETSALAAYTAYLREFSRVDLERTLAEIESFEDEYFRQTLDTRDLRQLHAAGRHLERLEDLFEMRISRPDFERLQADSKDVRFRTVTILSFLNRLLVDAGRFEDVLAYTPDMDHARATAETFYRENDLRDEAMVKNLAAHLKGEKVAVLVAGGWHTENLKRLLAEKDFSYAVVSPNVEVETNHERYEKTLMEGLNTATSSIPKRPLLEIPASFGRFERELGAIRASAGGRLAQDSPQSRASEARRGARLAGKNIWDDPVRIESLLVGIYTVGVPVWGVILAAHYWMRFVQDKTLSPDSPMSHLVFEFYRVVPRFVNYHWTNLFGDFMIFSSVSRIAPLLIGGSYQRWAARYPAKALWITGAVLLAGSGVLEIGPAGFDWADFGSAATGLFLQGIISHRLISLRSHESSGARLSKRTDNPALIKASFSQLLDYLKKLDDDIRLNRVSESQALTSLVNWQHNPVAQDRKLFGHINNPIHLILQHLDDNRLYSEHEKAIAFLLFTLINPDAPFSILNMLFRRLNVLLHHDSESDAVQRQALLSLLNEIYLLAERHNDQRTTETVRAGLARASAEALSAGYPNAWPRRSRTNLGFIEGLAEHGIELYGSEGAEAVKNVDVRVYNREDGRYLTTANNTRYRVFEADRLVVIDSFVTGFDEKSDEQTAVLRSLFNRYPGYEFIVPGIVASTNFQRNWSKLENYSPLTQDQNGEAFDALRAERLRDLESRSETELADLWRWAEAYASVPGARLSVSAKPSLSHWKLEWVDRLGRGVYISRNVLNPKNLFTERFLDMIDAHPGLFEGKKGLELGVGSGVLTIAQARAGAASIVGTDIVPESVEMTQNNLAEETRLPEHLSLLHSDLYSALTPDLVGDGFDYVVFNHPIYSADPIASDPASYIAEAGNEFGIIRNAIDGLPRILRPDGSAYFHAVRYVGPGLPPSFVWTEDKLMRALPDGWTAEAVGSDVEFADDEELKVFVYRIHRVSAARSFDAPAGGRLAQDSPQSRASEARRGARLAENPPVLFHVASGHLMEGSSWRLPYWNAPLHAFKNQRNPKKPISFTLSSIPGTWVPLIDDMGQIVVAQFESVAAGKSPVVHADHARFYFRQHRPGKDGATLMDQELASRGLRHAELVFQPGHRPSKSDLIPIGLPIVTDARGSIEPWRLSGIIRSAVGSARLLSIYRGRVQAKKSPMAVVVESNLSDPQSGWMEVFAVPALQKTKLGKIPFKRQPFDSVPDLIGFIGNSRHDGALIAEFGVQSSEVIFKFLNGYHLFRNYFLNQKARSSGRPRRPLILYLDEFFDEFAGDMRPRSIKSALRGYEPPKTSELQSAIHVLAADSLGKDSRVTDGIRRAMTRAQRVIDGLAAEARREEIGLPAHLIFILGSAAVDPRSGTTEPAKMIFKRNGRTGQYRMTSVEGGGRRIRIRHMEDDAGGQKRLEILGKPAAEPARFEAFLSDAARILRQQGYFSESVQLRPPDGARLSNAAESANRAAEIVGLVMMDLEIATDADRNLHKLLGQAVQKIEETAYWDARELLDLAIGRIWSTPNSKFRDTLMRAQMLLPNDYANHSKITRAITLLDEAAASVRKVNVPYWTEKNIDWAIGYLRESEISVALDLLQSVENDLIRYKQPDAAYLIYRAREIASGARLAVDSENVMGTAKSRFVLAVTGVLAVSFPVFFVTGFTALYWAWVRSDLQAALPYLPWARSFGSLAMIGSAAALAVLFSPKFFRVSDRDRLRLSALAALTIGFFSEFRNDGKFHFKNLVHFFGPDTWARQAIDSVSDSIGDFVYRVEYSHWNDFLMGPAIVSVLFAFTFLKIYRAYANSGPMNLSDRHADDFRPELDQALRFSRILMNVGLWWFFIQAWAEKAGYLRNPHSGDQIDFPFESAGAVLGFWMARALTRPFSNESEKFKSTFLVDFISAGALGLAYTLIVSPLTENLTGSIAHSLYPVVSDAFEASEYTALQRHMRPLELLLLGVFGWKVMNNIKKPDEITRLGGVYAEESEWSLPMRLLGTMGLGAGYFAVMSIAFSLLEPQGAGWTLTTMGAGSAVGLAGFLLTKRLGRSEPTSLNLNGRGGARLALTREELIRNASMAVSERGGLSKGFEVRVLIGGAADLSVSSTYYSYSPELFRKLPRGEYLRTGTHWDEKNKILVLYYYAVRLEEAEQGGIRWRHTRLSLFGDRALQTQSYVLRPDNFSTRLFLNFIIRHPEAFRGKRVLELGTGSGALAVKIRQVGSGQVVAVDVLPPAVRSAERNAGEFGYGPREILVGESDLYSAVRRLTGEANPKFDVIVFNHPIVDSEPDDDDPASLASNAGSDFRIVRDAIFHAPEFLKPGGSMYAWAVDDKYTHEWTVSRQKEFLDKLGFHSETADPEPGPDPRAAYQGRVFRIFFDSAETLSAARLADKSGPLRVLLFPFGQANSSLEKPPARMGRGVPELWEQLMTTLQKKGVEIVASINSLPDYSGGVAPTEAALRLEAWRKKGAEVDRILAGIKEPYDLTLQYSIHPILQNHRAPHVIWSDSSAATFFENNTDPFLRTERDQMVSVEMPIYQSAAGVMTFSAFQRERLIRHYQLEPARVVNVGAAPLLKDIPVFEKKFDGKTILFVGRDFRNKGGYELLDAFAKVRERIPDARLKIVSADPELAKRIEWPAGVEYLGGVAYGDRERISELYEEANVFAMPSHVEAFGLVYLEAMAYKTPVVGAQTVAAPEVILGDSPSGFVVDSLKPGGYAELADILIRLLENPGLSRELGENGYRKVRQWYNWDSVADRMIQRFDAIKASSLGAKRLSAARLAEFDVEALMEHIPYRPESYEQIKQAISGPEAAEFFAAESTKILSGLERVSAPIHTRVRMNEPRNPEEAYRSAGRKVKNRFQDVYRTARDYYSGRSLWTHVGEWTGGEESDWPVVSMLFDGRALDSHVSEELQDDIYRFVRGHDKLKDIFSLHARGYLFDALLSFYRVDAVYGHADRRSLLIKNTGALSDPALVTRPSSAARLAEDVRIDDSRDWMTSGASIPRAAGQSIAFHSKTDGIGVFFVKSFDPETGVLEAVVAWKEKNHPLTLRPLQGVWIGNDIRVFYSKIDREKIKARFFVTVSPSIQVQRSELLSQEKPGARLAGAGPRDRSHRLSAAYVRSDERLRPFGAMLRETLRHFGSLVTLRTKSVVELGPGHAPFIFEFFQKHGIAVEEAGRPTPAPFGAPYRNVEDFNEYLSGLAESSVDLLLAGNSFYFDPYSTGGLSGSALSLQAPADWSRQEKIRFRYAPAARALAPGGIFITTHYASERAKHVPAPAELETVGLELVRRYRSGNRIVSVMIKKAAARLADRFVHRLKSEAQFKEGLLGYTESHGKFRLAFLDMDHMTSRALTSSPKERPGEMMEAVDAFVAGQLDGSVLAMRIDGTDEYLVAFAADRTSENEAFDWLRNLAAKVKSRTDWPYADQIQLPLTLSAVLLPEADYSQLVSLMERRRPITKQMKNVFGRGSINLISLRDAQAMAQGARLAEARSSNGVPEALLPAVEKISGLESEGIDIDRIAGRLHAEGASSLDTEFHRAWRGRDEDSRKGIRGTHHYGFRLKAGEYGVVSVGPDGSTGYRKRLLISGPHEVAVPQERWTPGLTERLRRIQNNLERGLGEGSVERIWVFGSYADGDWTRDVDDVDLFIQLKDPRNVNWSVQQTVLALTREPLFLEEAGYIEHLDAYLFHSSRNDSGFLEDPATVFEEGVRERLKGILFMFRFEKDRSGSIEADFGKTAEEVIRFVSGSSPDKTSNYSSEIVPNPKRIRLGLPAQWVVRRHRLTSAEDKEIVFYSKEFDVGARNLVVEDEREASSLAYGIGRGSEGRLFSEGGRRIFVTRSAGEAYGPETFKDPAAALAFAEELGRALGEIHRAGLFHEDLVKRTREGEEIPGMAIGDPLDYIELELDHIYRDPSNGRMQFIDYGNSRRNHSGMSDEKESIRRALLRTNQLFGKRHWAFEKELSAIFENGYAAVFSTAAARLAEEPKRSISSDVYPAIARAGNFKAQVLVPIALGARPAPVMALTMTPGAGGDVEITGRILSGRRLMDSPDLFDQAPVAYTGKYSRQRASVSVDAAPKSSVQPFPGNWFASLADVEQHDTAALYVDMNELLKTNGRLKSPKELQEILQILNLSLAYRGRTSDNLRLVLYGDVSTEQQAAIEKMLGSVSKTLLFVNTAGTAWGAGGLPEALSANLKAQGLRITKTLGIVYSDAWAARLGTPLEIAYVQTKPTEETSAYSILVALAVGKDGKVDQLPAELRSKIASVGREAGRLVVSLVPAPLVDFSLFLADLSRRTTQVSA